MKRSWASDNWQQFKLLEKDDNRKEPLQLLKVFKNWTRSVVIEMEKEIGYKRGGD